LNKTIRRLSIFLLILAAAGILFFGGSVRAESYQENVRFDIEASYGYENTVRPGRDAVFRIKIHNHEEDFDGTVKIMTSSYKQESYYTSSIPFVEMSGARYLDNVGYEKLIAIPSGKTVEESFTVSFSNTVPFVKIILTDRSGEVTAEKVLRISVRDENSEILIGILDEQFEEYSRLDGMHLQDYPNVSIRVARLDEDAFREGYHGLDMLDIVWAEGDILESLGELQTEAIDKWVRYGGVLIEGVRGCEKEYCLSKSFWGDGRKIVYGFRDVQIEHNEPEAEEFLTGLMHEVYTENNLAAMDSGSYFWASEDYWDALSRVGGLNVENIPDTQNYMIVLLVYIVLAGPIVYLLLKKFDCRKYLWGCVGVLAIAFTCIIYLMGSETRFHAPFINYVRTLNMSEEYVDEQIEMSVQAPSNILYSVYMDGSYEVSPLFESGYYNEENQETGDFERESVRIVYGDEETQLVMEAEPAFTETYFKADKTTKKQKEQGITGTLYFYDEKLSGTIKNNTVYDLEDVFLFFRNHLVYVGDLLSGGSVDMKEQKLYFFSPGYGYDLLDILMECPEGYMEDITEEASSRVKKRDLIYKYLMEGYDSGEGRCVLAGFSDSVPVSLMRDSAYKLYGDTLVISDVDLNMTKALNGMSWRYEPFITSTAKLVSGNYGIYENICYSRETVLEYRIPDDLERMELEFVNEEYFDTEYYRNFEGEIEIYDQKKKAYEMISAREKIRGEALESYISEEGTLRVKFRRKEATQDKSEKLPVIVIRGREISAGN